jgi:hypothetical protein
VSTSASPSSASSSRQWHTSLAVRRTRERPSQNRPPGWQISRHVLRAARRRASPQIPHHPSRVMATAAPLEPPKPQRQRPRQPQPVRHLREQRRARLRGASRGHVTRRRRSLCDAASRGAATHGCGRGREPRAPPNLAIGRRRGATVRSRPAR